MVNPRRLAPSTFSLMPDPVQLRLGQLGSGAEHLGQSVRQGLLNGTRQTGAIEGSAGLFHAHAGREKTMHRVEPQTAGRASVLPGTDLRGTAGKQLDPRIRVGRREVEQVERPCLVHGNPAAGHRQVGKAPQTALLRRRDHVGCVPRLGSGRNRVEIAAPDHWSGTAENIKSLPVLIKRRRVDELNRHVLPAAQQLRAHAYVPS